MNSGEPMYFLRECPDKPMDGKKGQDIIHRQSDNCIVSEKLRNGSGEKAVATIHWGARGTSAGHRTGQQMRTKLAPLTRRARRDSKCEFVSLAHILTKEFLLGCFRELKRNKATGIDGVTYEEYEVNLDGNLEDLIGRLKEKRYRPLPVKRTYIEKADGSERGLGIPTLEDKIVQMGIKKILEAIYEVDFMDVSYGFRPGRSCHDALDEVYRVVMTKPVNWVVDMDIEKFFDTINHDWLLKCLKVRIKDSSLLRLVVRYLKAGVMDEGTYYRTDVGTPQGGVLSPILANIYLHYILDLWFERRIRKNLKGYAKLVRFADDYIVCFQNQLEAKEFGNELRKRYRKFGLKVNESKSRIIEFGRYAWKRAKSTGKKVAVFDFLVFTYYCGESGKGNFLLGRKTSGKRLRRKLAEINIWMKRVRSTVKLEEWWKVLRQKLIGHNRYYGISGNIHRLGKFNKRVSKLAFKWINRRSQKKSYTLKQYFQFVKYNPLPKPKIYHSYPDLGFGKYRRRAGCGKSASPVL